MRSTWIRAALAWANERAVAPARFDRQLTPQWSTKSYDFATDTPIPFPSDLAALCQRVVGDMPWGDVFSEGLPDWSTSDDYGEFIRGCNQLKVATDNGQNRIRVSSTTTS